MGSVVVRVCVRVCVCCVWEKNVLGVEQGEGRRVSVDKGKDKISQIWHEELTRSI